MSKLNLTTNQQDELIDSVSQFIDTLTSELYVFAVITYDPSVTFNKRPFSDNYLDVYNDNRMFKQLIRPLGPSNPGLCEKILKQVSP